MQKKNIELHLKLKRKKAIKQTKATAFNKFLRCFDRTGFVKKPNRKMSQEHFFYLSVYDFETINVQMRKEIERINKKYDLEEKSLRNS